MVSEEEGSCKNAPVSGEHGTGGPLPFPSGARHSKVLGT